MVAQQKQLDSLVDRVALLLSSMHGEILQDVRQAVSCPDLTARLCEMRKLGELLDERLAALRAEAKEERLEQLTVLQGRVETLETSKEEKLQLVVTENCMAVHDRVTREVEGRERIKGSGRKRRV